MKAADALIDALRSHAPAPSGHTRTLRICVAGRREFGYLPMGSGGSGQPVELESEPEIAAIMESREAVEL